MLGVTRELLSRLIDVGPGGVGPGGELSQKNNNRSVRAFGPGESRPGRRHGESNAQWRGLRTAKKGKKRNSPSKEPRGWVAGGGTTKTHLHEQGRGGLTET